MRSLKALLCSVLLLVICLLPMPCALAQSSTATLSGTVVDEAEGVVPDVKITVQNDATSRTRNVTSNASGRFTIPLLPPGNYTLTALRDGFAPMKINNIVLNVNDERALKIQMKVGQVGDSVTVEASTAEVSTSSAVATIVDQNLVSRIPLNGRTIQNLIALTPGALTVIPATTRDNVGQISVNGLRTTMNYMTIDGVSANLYVGTSNFGNSQTNGLIPGFSQLGTTSNLASMDALQEFKVQSASYSAEFGRSPGAQIQLTTKSGTNEWHGSASEYFRNDKLDAADWFVNAQRLAKPPLRHNLFGGTFSGPINLPKKVFGPAGYDGRNRTFFFFSYEGTRLRLPQVLTNASVPSRLMRQTAAAALQPFLAAFPQPTGPDAANGLTAPFSTAYSNPQTQDATSIRVDHNLTKKVTLFGRYNYSPSLTDTLTPANSRATRSQVKTTTVTTGANVIFSPSVTNEFRFNWSRNQAFLVFDFVSIAGTQRPPLAAMFPAPLTEALSSSSITIGQNQYVEGSAASSREGERHQINVTDNLSWVRGNHLFKFGADYRRSPSESVRPDLALFATFSTLASVQTAVATTVNYSTSNPLLTKFSWSSTSAFAQDTWKVTKRLTLDYGVRWDLNPPPDFFPAMRLAVVDGVTPAHLLPAGEGELFPTIYTGFAPRLGAAYQLVTKPGWELVMRGGYGLFYDIGSGTFGNVSGNFFPYAASIAPTNVPYPFSQAFLTSPPVANPNPPYTSGNFVAQYDQGFVLPRVHQWNLALEQALGREQKLTVTYVGNAGRRLIRHASLFPVSRLYPIPSPDFPGTNVLIGLNSNREGRADSSDYQALQVQFNRRGKRLNALVNYTWSHAIDTGSSPGDINTSNFFVISPSTDRADSTFDRRHIFSSAITWDLPSVPANGGFSRALNAVTRDWAFDTIFQAQSAYPFTVFYSDQGTTVNLTALGSVIRPDRVPGVSFWIDDPSAATGRRINPAAFSIPTTLRQGNLPRNGLRGFAIWQPDIAIGRNFRLAERMNLRFRAEMFNFINHPVFSTPNQFLGTKLVTGVFSPIATFGTVTTMLNRTPVGEGIGLSSIYQMGGPRSIQLSLKLSF